MEKKMNFTSAKLKGYNRCNTRRSRNLDLSSAKNAVLEKTMVQKNAVKNYFAAKRMLEIPHFENLVSGLYHRYIGPMVPEEDIPEEVRNMVKAIRKVLYMFDDNILLYRPADIPNLIRKVTEVAITPSSSGDLFEAPVIEDYIKSSYQKIGDITKKTSELQAEKAFRRIVRYVAAETRLPFIPAESSNINMFDLLEVEDKPDMVFFSENGKSVEAAKICCKKPDISQSGKTRDKSATHSLELYAKLCSAKQYGKGSAASVTGSFYFLGRKDDVAKTDSFESDYFAPRGGNIVTLHEELDENGTVLLGEGLEENFLRMAKEFAEGEDGCNLDCSHCDYCDICNFVSEPKSSDEEKAKKIISDIALSKAQEEAVMFRSGIGRINAVAGCGKTMIVALRTAYMLSEGIQPEDILLITFTNAGAKEMKERIEMYDEDLMNESDLSKLTCTTFNSFGDSIIRKEYALFGYSAEPRLIDDIERKKIITELLNENTIEGLNYENLDFKGGALPTTEKAFSVIKKHRYTLYDIDAFSDVMKGEGYHNTKSVNEDLLMLYEHYDRLLKERNLIEYQDQESLLFDLLDMNPYYFEENEDVCFKHIIIDEFQDTSDNQIKLVKKLTETKDFESLIVVGDDSQTIFEFRDAVTENIVDFFDKFDHPGQDFYITENFRSTPEILNFANTLIKKNKIRVEKELVATRSSGKPVEVSAYYKKDDELSAISDIVEEKLAEGKEPEDIAILAGTRSELIAIAGTLAKRGIETSLQCPEPMLENSRVKGIISFARMLRDDAATVDILNFKNCMMDGKVFDKTDTEIEAMIMNAQDSIEQFKELPYLDKVANFDRIVKQLAGKDSVALNMVERLERLSGLKAKQQYIEEFVRFGGESVKRESQNYSGVVLSTAHSSKGLEWPVVINSITSYDNGQLTPKTAEGKRRLLFVSSTRARDELYITGQYRIRGTKGDNGEYQHNRFLRESFEAIGKEFKPLSMAEEKKQKAEEKKRKEEEQKKNVATA